MAIPYWLKPKIEVIDKKDIIKINEFSRDSLVSVTREKIKSCCTEIADRTLSIKFHKFDKINLENTKTYKLSAAEIEKYLDALRKIDSSYDIKNKDIDIDIGGFSQEVSKELGKDYLKGNYILISTKQKDCDDLRNYFSSEKYLLKEFLNSNIGQILLGEALIGRSILDIENIFNINNPDKIFDIVIIFDTPTDSITKLKNIRDGEKELSNNIDRIKDRKFLKKLLEDIEDILSKHGPLDRLISNQEYIIKNRVNYFYLKTGSIDIYCLMAKIPIFVYFDYNNIIKEDYVRNDYIILNGQRIDNINKLIDLELFDFSPYLGFEKAVDMIIEKRKADLRKFIENNPESSSDFRKSFMERLMKKEKLPKEAKELLLSIQSLIDNKNNRKFFYSLGKNKIYYIYPLIQNEILYDLRKKIFNVMR